MSPSIRQSGAPTRAYYRALLEHTRDLIAVVDEDGVFDYVSPSARHVIGVDPDALRGTGLLERVHPTDRVDLNRALAAARAAPGTPMDVTFRIGSPAGAWLVMEALATHVSSASQVSGTIVNARDVTERVVAQLEGERGRERMGRFQRLISDLASNPVLDAGDLVAASREVCRVAAEGLGVERASVWLLSEGNLELKGVALYELSHDRYSQPPSLRAPDYPHYFQALETGRAIDAHDARSDPRTSEFAEDYLKPLGIVSMLDAGARLSGRVVGVVCCEHVGRRRTWRPDEVSFAGELADQVVRALLGVSRQAAVAERSEVESQLRHAQKLSTIGTLTSGIAHDFNNILSPILGFSEMALEELPADTPASRYIEEVVTAAGRAQDLVVRILSFSRDVEQRREKIDARLVVEEAVRLMRATLPPTLKVSTELSDEPVPIRGDASQLHQVLMNLCTNASQAVGDAPGRLSVAVAIVTGDGGEPMAAIDVADDGCGMAPETLERIFEPFFTTKPIGEGTGLGLSIARGIVEEHGGRITVESVPGEGATFRVLLPLATSGDETESEDA